IVIHAYREGGDLLIDVCDNGLGMPHEVAERLLDGNYSPSGKGSGIGLRNVQQRIRLTYGEPYGLTIDSEPDEGTTVRIRIPAIDAGVLREGGNGR
ncbi:MAG: ATP-binding protein, partial [Oscillospiraceae bacterium]